MIIVHGICLPSISQKPGYKTVVEDLKQFFNHHVDISKTCPSDKVAVFISQFIKDLPTTAWIKIEHATVNLHWNGKVGRSYHKLKQIFKIIVLADSPRWHKFVNLAVMMQSTNHLSLKCIATEVTLVRRRFNSLHIKFEKPLIHPNITVIKTSSTQ